MKVSKSSGDMSVVSTESESSSSRQSPVSIHKPQSLSSVDSISRSPGSEKRQLFSRRRISSVKSPKVKSKFYLDTEPISASPPLKSRSASSSKDAKSKTFVYSSPPHSPSPKLNRRQKSEEKGSLGNQSLNQTHIATFDFYPRHKDELMLKQGDPLHVIECQEDLWMDAINLFSTKRGILPARYAASIMSQENKEIARNSDTDEFYLRFLGSIEVADLKGDEVLCYAISKIVNQHASLVSSSPYPCTIQITKHGIRITPMTRKDNNQNKSKKSTKTKKSDRQPAEEPQNLQSSSNFFAMKNVTFCGNHPRDRRYFGFITKHPEESRYACHVLVSKYSTDQIAESFGISFKKFHEDYLEQQNAISDIYIE